MPCLSVHPAAASRSGTARAYRNVKVGLTDRSGKNATLYLYGTKGPAAAAPQNWTGRIRAVAEHAVVVAGVAGRTATNADTPRNLEWYCAPRPPDELHGQVGSAAG